jgi:enamine deaminase RidA (YjgF/YER057c/UK114 family)
MKLTHLNPPGLPNWSALFSQVVIVEEPPIRIAMVSGQVGVDERQLVAGDGSFSAQVQGAFANLKVALSAAGCSVTDVAKLTIYVVGYAQQKAGELQGVMRQHFGDGPLPALTLVGVQSLARAEFQIEVEAVAITRSGR